MSDTILITGGSGFVGSTLAQALRRDGAAHRIVALDNLSRRGSELNIPRLRAAGVEFVHGDVRNTEDLAAVGAVDWLLECSAEPSVHAGYGANPAYLLNTNLGGAINCLEHLRQSGGRMLFLSTSRIYPIAALRTLPLETRGERFAIAAGQRGPGWSEQGIAEAFSLEGSRSLYGATKLAAELLITEYAAMYGIEAVVNRCGVLAGPWQMGKVDQGFIALWVSRHLFGGTLSYMGFGGTGHQVRDVLHIDDLYDLVRRQLAEPSKFAGHVCNVGGGTAGSVSLRELTAMCAEVTGKRLDIGVVTDTRDADIPYYVSDIDRITALCGWRPALGPARLVEDVCRWLTDNRAALELIFKG